MTFVTTPTSLLMPDGQDFDLFPSRSGVSIPQAASVLRMSEMHLNNLLDMGEMETQMENGKRVIVRESFLEFKQEQERSRRWLDEMVRENQEMGLYDMEFNLEEYNATRNAIREENRRSVLRSLIGSIDDPTFVEPAEVEYESPKDWELMDQ